MQIAMNEQSNTQKQKKHFENVFLLRTRHICRNEKVVHGWKHKWMEKVELHLTTRKIVRMSRIASHKEAPDPKSHSTNIEMETLKTEPNTNET